MAKTVGVVGLPELADLLRSVGFDVVGGGDFADAATAIKERLEADASDSADGPDSPAEIPVIAPSLHRAGIRMWLKRQTGTVVLVEVEGKQIAPFTEAVMVPLPAGVDDAVCAAGFNPIGGDIGSIEFNPDGSLDTSDANSAASEDAREGTGVATETEAAPAPTVPDAVEPWDDEPEEQAPAPISPPPAPPAEWDDEPVVAADDNPWDDEPEEQASAPVAPAPRSAQRPAERPTARPAARPAPVDEPVDTGVSPWDDEPEEEAPAAPAPAPRPASRPAQRQTPRPAPVEDHVSDPEDDLWDDEPDDNPIDSVLDLGYEDEEDEAPARPGRTRRSGNTPNRGRLTPVIFSIAFKGGVGKTTTALALAERAASVGEMKVVVIDANRGQGDVTTYLRLRSAKVKVPTIYDAAVSGDPKRGFAQPSLVNDLRHARLDNINFGLILGPPAGKANPKVVTTAVYQEAIDFARRHSDLVIVDTQIIESFDTSGLIDGSVIPTLRDGGWAIVSSDASSAAVSNTHDGINRIRKQGVPPERLMFFLNRVDDESSLALDRLETSFKDRATLLGMVPSHDQTVSAINTGSVASKSPQMIRVLDEVLYRVTANQVFDPAKHDIEDQSAGIGGIIKKFLGRKG